MKRSTNININEADVVFRQLYGSDPDVIARQKIRYADAIEAFYRIFPSYDTRNASDHSDPSGEEDPVLSVYSAPGRTEICGNHTDHQHGRVLAAAIDLDAIAVVAANGIRKIRVQSEGYPPIEVDLSDYAPRKNETGRTGGLIRGVAAQFASRGIDVPGFDAYVTSDVLSGSGLSSSAAFEVLMGTIIDHLGNGGQLGPVEIAKFGQIAENQYFGKASGLMDQMVSAVGGLVEIDFADPENPNIDSHQCDLEAQGLTLIVTDTKGSHSNLSGEYSAIPEEMRSVASFFGKKYLRDVEEEAFYEALPRLRRDPAVGDRAILRSAHFWEDDRRVHQEAEALRSGDLQRFLDLINASGRSSECLLQNLYCTRTPQIQEIPLALMLSRRVLRNEGACRVHGGGFAGTIQAFVPKTMVDEYTQTLEAVFGRGACHILKIRPSGGVKVF